MPEPRRYYSNEPTTTSPLKTGFMLSFNKTESAIFVSLMCSLLPEDNHSELILPKNIREVDFRIFTSHIPAEVNVPAAL